MYKLNDQSLPQICESLFEPCIYHYGAEIPEVQKKDAVRVHSLWNLALHWVIKLKWKSNYKIPYDSKVARIIKPLGELIFWHLELCIQCHSLLSPPNPYESAGEWFYNFVRESQINTIFDPSKVGKTENIKLRKQLIDDISNGINPIEFEHCPHNWRLIETALRFNRGDNFDVNYLQPFIKSFRAWNSATDLGDWQAVLRDSENLYVRTGQGKGKRLLNFPKTVI